MDFTETHNENVDGNEVDEHLGLIFVLAMLTFKLYHQIVTTELCTCALERFSPSVYRSSSISLSNI